MTTPPHKARDPIGRQMIHGCRATLRFGLLLVLLHIFAVAGALGAGSWTPLANYAPGGISLMLLLPDGTVMAANASDASAAWYKLTPDSQGHYVNGTWSTLSSMNYGRLYFASQVLRNGKVFIAGGEYGAQGEHSADSKTAELYDPGANTWTLLPSSGADFLDSVSTTLPDGNVMVAPVYTGGTIIFNYLTNAWTTGPAFVNSSTQDEASWVTLPDQSTLTIDPFGTKSERYIPAENKWINDSVVPVSLYDSFDGELGAAFLLPNGNAFFIGSTPYTAIYTPSGSTSPGVWVAGADIPNQMGAPDAAAAMMVNGKILCALSPTPSADGVYPSPTSFYEYDYTINSFAQVGAPGGGLTVNEPSYVTAMLDLPDGTVLFSQEDGQLYVYTPDGTPVASGMPAITSISANGNGTYHLTGTLFNGISEGAAYGDDWQMSTNYPLVQLTSGGGTVYYARTYNWSNSGVMTGTTPVTTEFEPPAQLPTGTYSLAVVANGISSSSIQVALSGTDSNDDFINATVLTGTVGTVAGSNIGYTKQPGEPNHAGNAGGASAWYSWTAPAGGQVEFDTFGSNFNTLLAVYTGASVASLTAVASNDDAGGTSQSQVFFSAALGTTYHIAVDGYNGATGNIVLNYQSPPPLATLTVAANPTNGGTTSGGGSYAIGSSQQISATANSGWLFNDWSDGNVSNPRTVIVPAGGATYTAEFVQGGVLTVVANPSYGGTVSGGGTYAAGSSQQISATANSGYIFTGWSDGNLQNPRTVSVPAGGATYTAEFTQGATLTVLASPSYGGTVSGGGTYAAGSSQQIGATPHSGYTFTGWSDGNTQNPRTVTVPTGGVTYTADFTQTSVLTVQASPPAGGTVSGGGTYTAGSTVQISATASAGYIFTGWSDGNTQNPRTVTVTAGGGTYTAEFSQIAALAVQANPANGGSVSGSGTFIVGTNHQISATANTGYIFTGWNDGNTQNPRTVTVPAGGVTYTAEFSQTALLAVQANPSIGGSASGGGTYIVGSNQQISATANTGYVFTGWNDGNTQNPRTVSVPVGGATYTAEFSQTAVLTVQANPLNGGSASGGGTFIAGSNQQISATANAGYVFTGWNDGNTQNPRTVAVPVGGVTYTAEFAPTAALTVQANPLNGGSASGGGVFIIGSDQQIGATANAGYVFTGWNDGNTQNPRTVAVPVGGVTYTADFSPTAALSVQASPSDGGSASGGGTYIVGSTEQISATANAGYIFTGWSDSNVQNPRTVTVTAGGVTYTADFSPTAALTVEASPVNGGNVSSSGTYIVGSTEQIGATANAGYVFTGWNDGNMQNPRSVTVTAGGVTYTADFSPTAALAVQASPVNGGSVSASGTFIVGSTPQISATANAGWVFAGWNDQVTQNPRNVTVPGSGATYTALFTAVLAEWEGSYAGAADGTGGAGLAKMTITANGAFTAAIKFNGGPYSLHGVFASNGAFAGAIPHTSYSISLNFDSVAGDITGVISLGGSPAANVLLRRSLASVHGNFALYQGTYTFIMPPNAGVPAAPQGTGEGTVTVGKAGGVTFKGKLGDGTPFVQYAAVSQEGTFPVYMPLYKKKGFISGEVTFESTGANDLDGTINWSKSNSFDTGISLIGSRFTMDATLADSFEGDAVTVSGGSIAPFDANAVVVSPDMLSATAADDRKVVLTLGLGTGDITAKLLNPDGTLAIKFTGVILEKQNQAAGFYLGPSGAGSFNLNAP